MYEEPRGKAKGTVYYSHYDTFFPLSDTNLKVPWKELRSEEKNQFHFVYSVLSVPGCL